MPETPNVPVLSWDLTPVTASPPLRPTSRRHPPGATISRTGRTTLNLWATEILTELVKQAGPSDKPHTIQPAVNVEAGIIGLYVVEPGTLGSVAPKPIDRALRTSIDLAAVFGQYPELQTGTSRHCPLNRATDKKGKDCLVIALKGSVVRTRVRRTASTSVTKTG